VFVNVLGVTYVRVTSALALVGALTVSTLLTGCNTDAKQPSSIATSAPTSAAGTGTGHVEDVTIISCDIDPTIQFPAIKYTVTNHSSKRSNYIIEIVVTNAAGQQVGTAPGAVNGLEPGQSTAPQDTSTAAVAAGPIKCKVSSVSRYAAAG
jgi:hypothetical protein